MSESSPIPKSRNPLPLIRLLAERLVKDYLHEQQESEATTSANQPPATSLPDDEASHMSSQQSVAASGAHDGGDFK